MPSNNPWPNIAPMSADHLNELVEILSTNLESIIHNSETFCSNTNLSAYHSVDAFSSSIKDYILRYVEHIGLNEVHLIVAQIFLDRYLKYNQEYPLTKLNVFRLLATIYLITNKLCEDGKSTIPLSIYAEVAGLPTLETKQLEVTLLTDLNYNLFITPALYLEYKMTFVYAARRALHRDDGSLYTLSMHPEELAMIEELHINPLYHPPENADVPIDPNLLADEEVTSASAAASSLNTSTTEAQISSPPEIIRRNKRHAYDSHNPLYQSPANANISTAPKFSPLPASATMPAVNTNATEDQLNSAPEIIRQGKKQKKGHAYDPRFLAAVSAPVLPTAHISNQASAAAT